VNEPYAIAKTPYLALKLTEKAGISTGSGRTIAEIEDMIARKRDEHNQSIKKYGALSEVYDAMQTCLAWDTVYDPQKNRIVSPVSRRWSKNWGGYVLFCWDNYFAACIASLGSKAVAYSNLIEMTREKVESGFVPNLASALGASTRDRSQPPVGSLALREIYRKYREEWLIEYIFDDLMEWNTWYFKNRQSAPGLLSWGSNPFEPLVGHYVECLDINNRQGAAYESGLDNSPMYDDVPFDAETHMLALYDAGLTGLYIMDCHILAELAEIIGRNTERALLEERAALCETGLHSLWDEEAGFFFNKRSDTGEWNRHISPTNFYAMNSCSLSPEQSERISQEHFYNPDEFWGEYIMPSIARNDPAYPEQEYWRGRIWAPMNFLVYIALKNQKQHKAADDLAERSASLLLKEWRSKRHIHENYGADTGEGCDKQSSDGFYHWGGLLGLIALMEAGF
jgi:neutral trehalase